MLPPTRRGLLRRGLQLSCGAAATLLAAPSFGQEATKGEIRIACVGDSMIDGVWGGLLRLVSKEACLKPRIKLGRYGENGTGLTRPDRYSWPEAMTDIFAEFKPDLILVSMGLNDRQGVVNPKTNTRVVFGAKDWSQAYEAEVSAFLSKASTAPAGLIWLGIPVLRDQAAQAESTEINHIYAHAIAALNNKKAVFVDAWRQDGSKGDVFQAYAPDASGSKVQIRTQDGVHFTPAGYDMISAYLLPKIIAQLSANGIEVAYPCPS
ncbi:hypothetical protein B1812_04005 [Methylocystis bryophila]|uniref:Uncharacterized protein n=1 Tax=Methylocystis bryophila TaxID=655015 RepID=A0A1W6N0N5_9HYPH|nr:hypothetical protein B1812_04005 [Methylocystis bryophila]